MKKKRNARELVYRLVERDGIVCGICRADLSTEIRQLIDYYNRREGAIRKRHKLNINIDHIEPRSISRNSTLGNLQLSHRNCNAEKGNSTHQKMHPIPPLDVNSWKKSKLQIYD